ncbi:MAG: PAS domain S-box protein [Deltaproteobacteria bacterium]|nr:PAS domain S-box protein [Deltaproteobacteria bacterium]
MTHDGPPDGSRRSLMGNILRAVRSLSIRGKVLLAFAGVIALVALGNLYSVISVAEISGRSGFARAVAFRKMVRLVEVENLVKRTANSAATAADVGIPEPLAQARALRAELEQQLTAAEAEFPRDRALLAEFRDLRARTDEHLKRSAQLLDLAVTREWSAFGPGRQELQAAQAQLFRRVAQSKARCLTDLDHSLAEIAHLTRRTTTGVAGATVLALVAALLVAFYLSGEIVSPLQRLLAAMGHARAGDFSVRAGVESRDETGALARCFDELLHHLERRDAEIRLHRDHLEELVEERTAQLEVANQTLQTELEIRQITEAALAESEERLRHVLASVRAGILIVDAQRDEILEVNDFALEMIGASREEVLGRPSIGYLTGGADALPVSDGESDLGSSEGQLHRADGWCLPILCSTAQVAYQGRAHHIRSFIDLSDVKRQEKAVRESEQRYRTLFASAQEAIFIVDPGAGSPARIVDLNPAAARMHGGDVDQLKGAPLAQIDGGRLLTDGRREAILRGEWVRAEILLHHRDTGEFPVQVSAGPLDFGDLRYVLAFGRDVTEQKKAREELEAFNERLARSNQDLEDFAYVASHDLQEPLRKVQAFGDRLKAKHGDALGDQGRDYLERMQNAAQRMQCLIEDLLTFSRVTTKARPFETVDLAQVAREVLSDLEVRIEQTGARVDLGPLPTLEADPLQLRQLLQNLIGNALKFRRPGEAPVVRVSAESAEASGGPAGEPRLCLSVEDEGIGFDPKYADRIFGVFQRLHGRGEYEGTGVGLAVCRKIAERHRGSIAAQGRPGQGARFVVTLPVSQPNV